MKILNKEQFAKTPIGTVFCLFMPIMLDERLYVKCDYHISEGQPTFNGAIPLCPFFETEKIGDDYIGQPSEEHSYYTECFSTDVALHDFEDDQLFAVFSKQEVRRMIDVLAFALSDCEGDCFTDSDDMILK